MMWIAPVMTEQYQWYADRLAPERVEKGVLRVQPVRAVTAEEDFSWQAEGNTVDKRTQITDIKTWESKITGQGGRLDVYV
ncbi:hypothetical protein G4V62_14790 [Bacillaceae bacterium SIJ1]|uniref:hypothetical protein n=1 Tax=Litoribacterium kuwaitense TaxID=1398745 RepID=UPI0013EB56B4|nr:hypothetical protein [Litoribacterium kuwaitense]NGP46154.1 hypothetical protein [Litoribacterium kuwaitense]